MISGAYLLFCATFFVLEQFGNRDARRMRERKRRRCRREVRRRQRRGSSRAEIDAVVEVQLPHDFHERRNRAQISLLQRNVGAAQRLGQPRDLEAGLVLRRIGPPLRQGLTDGATNRRRTLLCVARNLLNAVARHEQVEIRLSPLDQRLAANFARGPLSRPLGGWCRFIAHEPSRLANLD
jgi:hypothetical protein